MKALSMAVLTAGLACGAFGQGWFELDSSGLNNGVAWLMPGNRYNGVFGLEVWMLNGGGSGPPTLMDDLNCSTGCNSGNGRYHGKALSHAA